ncbi:rhodanese-like domain-containing protein [Maritalea mediterranea]|uniref:Rhodanese-like domain-containing protein n=1 Tax=Maritalea mediterranea TaxID=2909667 RepID=A0ABS9E3F4_9HYPH|nr:rhodanese-like domain-containing protein [Maritalea mediterranea]MCF4097399.1 rhodanese-like domain-containing protein [Maritalea mediterranea]
MKTVKELVDAATAEIETMSVDAAEDAVAAGAAQFVDIRDIRELNREGRIAGAVHVPRGMLEFWIDPTSPYHKPELATDKKLIFFCAAGWRSALATKTAKDMGFENVAHLEGGFGAWREAEGEIIAPKNKA